MAGPLEGIRVVECTQWVQGGTAGALLGDMGADVVKVEPPITGDPIRGWLKIGAAQTNVVERNYYLELCNRSKRSITLNLRKQKGKDIFYSLIEKADIFLHNWRLGTPEKLGADYETLSRYNPQLIYAEISGWGTKGPLREQAAYELAAMARAGMLDMVGEPDSAPVIWPSGHGDTIGAIVAVAGILAALTAQERSGIGQKVDVSLLGSLITVEAAQFYSWLLAGSPFPNRSRATIGNPLYSHYRCADGAWITLNMLEPDRYWSTFCRVMGIPELEHDPKFATIQVRSQNSVELISILDRIFATKPRTEWLRLFEEQGPGQLIYAPVQNVPEVANDPQVLANQYVVDFEHPAFGPIKVTGMPYKFGRTPAELTRAAPELGQHTEEILLESGYTAQDIARLKEEEVL